VAAEKFPGGQGFRFTVAAAYLVRSSFGFTIATADAAERKKLPSAAGWVGYEFTLKDFADPPGKPAPPDEPVPPPDRFPHPPDKPAPSAVVVDGETIRFDPKSCTQGRGQFFWGLGSCAVKVLGREGGRCVFEYTQEIEMGATVYLVRVPVDSGPVTVKIESVTERGSTFPWPVTSFPLDEARVVRRGGGRGRWEVRIGDTEDFVGLGPNERRSEMEPRRGDRVKFRFRVFDGPEFERLAPGVSSDLATEFVVGNGKGWAWLETAMEGMTVGDSRQVEVPLRAAEGARQWLPDPNAAKTFYVEIRLVSLERAK
jgi:hypothetical protein